MRQTLAFTILTALMMTIVGCTSMTNLIMEMSDTPKLILAANQGDLPRVKKELARGTDINIKDRAGATALMTASKEGHIDVVQFLLEKGADPNTKYYEDLGTALMWASSQGHVEVVKVLLGGGADVNAKTMQGQTALIVATKKGRVDIAKVLLAKGVDVNAKTVHGDTALDYAKRMGNAEMVQLLEKAEPRK